jgi:hypothetical protein
MKTIPRLTLAALVSAILAGCAGGPPQPAVSPEAKKEARIRESLARLDPKDRALAEAQQYCPIESDNRLGSMGPPVKVMVEDQPVFLCCKGCTKQALADPEKTLAKVRALKGEKTPPPEK